MRVKPKLSHARLTVVVIGPPARQWRKRQYVPIVDLKSEPVLAVDFYPPNPSEASRISHKQEA